MTLIQRLILSRHFLKKKKSWLTYFTPYTQPTRLFAITLLNSTQRNNIRTLIELSPRLCTWTHTNKNTNTQQGERTEPRPQCMNSQMPAHKISLTCVPMWFNTRVTEQRVWHLLASIFMIPLSPSHRCGHPQAATPTGFSCMPAYTQGNFPTNHTESLYHITNGAHTPTMTRMRKHFCVWISHITMKGNTSKHNSDL